MGKLPTKVDANSPLYLILNIQCFIKHLNCNSIKRKRSQHNETDRISSNFQAG